MENKNSFEDYGFAKIDYGRQARSGFPEAVLCEGKTIEQVTGIIKRMKQRGVQRILATRAAADVFEAVKNVAPDAVYNELGRTIVCQMDNQILYQGKILVMTAGTSDIPVAEEAAVTAEVFGSTVNRLYDVGVAGLQRLLSNLDVLEEADILIVAAGMDGALASVTAGLTDKPVIAVPTSVGYGASFGGVSALLAMLNNCAGGVSVMNIDNGFGAGLFASRINRLLSQKKDV